MTQKKIVSATKTAVLAGQYTTLCETYATAIGITLAEIDLCDENINILTGILFADMAGAAVSGLAKIDLIAPFQDLMGTYLCRANGVSYKATVSGYARTIELALANGVPLIVKGECRPAKEIMRKVKKFRAKTNGGRPAKEVKPAAPVAPTDALKLAETVPVTVPLVGRVFSALRADSRLRDAHAAEIRGLFAMLPALDALKLAPHVAGVRLKAPTLGDASALVVSKSSVARRQVGAGA